MIGGFYLANMYWQWKAGVTFVACAGCVIQTNESGQEVYFLHPDYQIAESRPSA